MIYFRSYLETEGTKRNMKRSNVSKFCKKQ